MKPLFVLIASFGISCCITWIVKDYADLVLSGCIAMSVMLVFTAIGHFKFIQGMALMLPAFIPFKKAMVIITGFIEIAAAVGLLLPAMRHATSIWLIIFFVLILPTNIYAAVKHIDYEKGNFEGKGTGYLWFRVPLQIFFIAWVWYFGIYLS